MLQWVARVGEQVNMAKRNVTKNTANRKHPVLAFLAVTILFLIVAAAVLFPFARDAYAAKRELDMSEQKLKDGKSRYKEIEIKLKELETTEGIEDQAHSLNLAYPDEQSVNITGLDDFGGSGAMLDSATDAKIPPPKSWWEERLDALFGLRPSSQLSPDGDGAATP